MRSAFCRSGASMGAGRHGGTSRTFTKEFPEARSMGPFKDGQYHPVRHEAEET